MPSTKLEHWKSIRHAWERQRKGRKYSSNPSLFEYQLWNRFLRKRDYVWLPDSREELRRISGRFGTQFETNFYGLNMLRRASIEERFRHYDTGRLGRVHRLGRLYKTYDYVLRKHLRSAPKTKVPYGLDAKSSGESKTPNQRKVYNQQRLAVVNRDGTMKWLRS